MSLALIVSIFAGGGLGSVSRHYAMIGVSKMTGADFFYGTLAVNVIGSFVIGALMEALALRINAPVEMRAFLVTGFLGGFTTFSAFSLDFYKLMQAGQPVTAALYAAASVFFSLLAVFAGVYLIRGVLGG